MGDGIITRRGRKSEIVSTLSATVGNSTSSTSASTATASVTLLANTKYIITSFANGGASSGTVGNNYANVNWTMEAVQLTSTGSTVTNIHTETALKTGNNALSSYRVDTVEVGGSNITFSAYCRSYNTSGTYSPCTQITISAISC